jgi:hypothetical protein
VTKQLPIADSLRPCLFFLPCIIHRPSPRDLLFYLEGKAAGSSETSLISIKLRTVTLQNTVIFINWRILWTTECTSEQGISWNERMNVRITANWMSEGEKWIYERMNKWAVRWTFCSMSEWTSESVGKWTSERGREKVWNWILEFTSQPQTKQLAL